MNPQAGLLYVIALLCIIALYTFLIMIIWNQVIIKKFPLSDIQKLSFWDALALSVFISILSGSGAVYVMNRCTN
jgi:hypothetical protein